jgi:hypothetical protein
MASLDLQRLGAEKRETWQPTFSTITDGAGDRVALTPGATLSMLVEGVGVMDREAVTLAEGIDVGLAVAEAVPGRAVSPMLTMFTPPLLTRIWINDPAERTTAVATFNTPTTSLRIGAAHSQP